MGERHKINQTSKLKIKRNVASFYEGFPDREHRPVPVESPFPTSLDTRVLGAGGNYSLFCVLRIIS